MERMVRVAVDLVNEGELPCVESAEAFLRAHDEPEPIEITHPELAGINAVRERLRPVFGAEPAEAARLLNGLLRDYAVRPYLTEHDGTPWHLHVAEPDAGWAEWLAAQTALALAGFAASHGFGALAECAAADCRQVFVNSTPKRPKRFCTPTCAGRTRVAAYRARRAL
ncbi:CGNR zinc finger domain-containing protein [Kribbella sp. NPDC056345]|uniref:CGNR zinc finger domain-containing protein n=1 Tax=Kribbella sp. NPDC056345 TaxID=3345789 RepID=UPI0035DFD579